MEAREVIQIANAVFDAKKYDLRTHVFVQVIEYDADKNLTKVVPVRKAIYFTDSENIDTDELPPNTEILVRQFGSGKLWLTVAPSVGTYGYLHVSDRDVDTWKSAGGIGEPTDTRCMKLRDAVFEPSLLHLVDEGDNGLLAVPVATDRISLRTRTGATEISVLDDESIEITTTGDVTIEATGNVETDAAETVLQAGTDWAVQYTALKSAFDTLKTDFNNLVTWCTTHVHPGVLAGAASTAVSPVPPVSSSADMSGSKVDDVRIP